MSVDCDVIQGHIRYLISVSLIHYHLPRLILISLQTGKTQFDSMSRYVEQQAM
jgi:hypothetical protein